MPSPWMHAWLRSTPIAIAAPLLLLSCARPQAAVPPDATVPELVWSPPLFYPPAEVKAGVEGSVLLEALIDTAGRVVASTVRVIDSSDEVFEAAAISMLRQSRFTPSRTGGMTAQVLVRLPVVFELRRGERVTAADSSAALAQVRYGRRLAGAGRIILYRALCVSCFRISLVSDK